MRSFLAVLVLMATVAEVSAQSWRERRESRRASRQGRYIDQNTAVMGSTVLTVNPGSEATPVPAPSARVEENKSTAAPVKSATRSDDALDEVNAARAQRGLKPYINDPVLNKAARRCAERRAAILCAGHCPESDFTYLDPVYPVGSCVGGCAAWEPSWGWGACATYDNYTYCGAAWVMGSDGRRYMHLFAR